MEKLINEYNKLLDSLQPIPVEQSVIDKYIDNFSRFATLTNSAITIYDNIAAKTIYMSDNYQNLFGTEENKIHPDDYEAVFKGALIAFRYFFIGNKNVANHRLIRKYRVKLKGEYRVVVEQMQPLVIDEKGNVCLSFDIVDIAPNQSPPYKVESKIMNFKTGDIITPVDEYLDGKPILSNRETEILQWIEQGLLSKEISEKLCISVHTVNTHRQRILEKLKVDTSIEAIKYASAMGIL